MRRPSSILVALDGSKASRQALEESIRLAQWTKGRVTAITVAPAYEGDLSLVGVKSVKDLVEGPGRKILSEAIDLAKPRAMSLRIAYESGDPGPKILERAKTENCDLILLGKSGDIHPLLAALTGSVMTDAVEPSTIDVLIIPEGKSIGWERILHVADGSDTGRNAALRAFELIATFDGSILDSAPTAGGSWKEVVRLATEHAATLIVLSCPGPKGGALRRLRCRYYLEVLAAHAPCPILVPRGAPQSG